MVVDHRFQIEPIELGSGCGGQFLHLLIAKHALHALEARLMMNIVGRHFESLVTQPPLHHGNLIVLRQSDAFGYRQNCRIIRPAFRQC